MKKICFVATIPAVVHTFLRGHIQAASEKYEVTVLCNSSDAHVLDGLNAKVVLLPIQRKPSPIGDLLILLRLISLFRSEQFDIVHTHMPKTGLLGMMAAWLTGMPIRVHTFHGEVWATRKGWKRAALKLSDRLVVWLATDILVVSPSQQKYLVAEGILPVGKSKIIASGSVCGVDAQRFHPDADVRLKVRADLGIPLDARVILFVGRLNRDKGMVDLALAFKSMVMVEPDLVLLLVGAEEDISFSDMQRLSEANDRHLRYLPFTQTPEVYMAAADIFCLPSYREGFPVAVLEAAACGVPAVASRIYGITDAVEDGATGILFEAGNIELLNLALLTLLRNEPLRKKMGRDARVRVLDFFPSEKVIQETLHFYDQLLAKV